MQLGNLQEAQDPLEQGLEALPGNPELLNLLGNVMAARGDVPSALTIAQELAKHFPEDPAAQGNYARLLCRHRAQARGPGGVPPHVRRGEGHPQLKSLEAMVLESQEPPDIAGAVAAYREAMKLDPADWGPASNNVGNLLMRSNEGSEQQNLAQAVEALEEARRRAPDGSSRRSTWR